MEDNLTSADPLSYITNGFGVDPGSLVSVSCVHNPTPSCGAPDHICGGGDAENVSSDKSFGRPPEKPGNFGKYWVKK